MKQFRLVGTEKTMIVVGHSSLDIGARIKADPDFYYVGMLEQIEDMGGLVIARVTAKGRIVPIRNRPEKDQKEPKERKQKPSNYTRERIVKKVFNW